MNVLPELSKKEFLGVAIVILIAALLIKSLIDVLSTNRFNLTKLLEGLSSALGFAIGCSGVSGIPYLLYEAWMEKESELTTLFFFFFLIPFLACSLAMLFTAVVKHLAKQHIALGRARRERREAARAAQRARARKDNERAVNSKLNEASFGD